MNMNIIDIDKLKDLEFKFVELDMYDEFEVVLTITKGEEKINQIYYLMKIPMQNEDGREYNAVSLLNKYIKIKLLPHHLVKPMLYKKLTMTKEERDARNRVYDMKYGNSVRNSNSNRRSANLFRDGDDFFGDDDDEPFLL